MKQELIEPIKNGVADISFTKADGTRREMKATLSESYILPEPKHSPARKRNLATQTMRLMYKLYILCACALLLIMGISLASFMVVHTCTSTGNQWVEGACVISSGVNELN